MKKKSLVISVALVALTVSAAFAARNEYAPKVPNGLAFSEFRGYESWPVIAVSLNEGKIAVILGNPIMIAAYKSGIPGNGKPFPDGSRMAKIHWVPRTQARQPGQPTVPGSLHDVDFMVKDSNRFADSGGWGWAAFDYEAASDTFRPADSRDQPPQGHDAKCGFACHTLVKDHDFVFTEYPKR